MSRGTLPRSSLLPENDEASLSQLPFWATGIWTTQALQTGFLHGALQITWHTAGVTHVTESSIPGFEVGIPLSMKPVGLLGASRYLVHSLQSK